MHQVRLDTDTRPFRLDQPVELPQDIVRHEVVDEAGQHCIFVSPAKAAYVVTSVEGAHLIERLRDGLTLGTATAWLRESHGLEHSEVRRVAQDVLTQVHKNGFYADAIPIEEDLAHDFAMQCYLTLRCNLNCTHCYVSSGPTVPIDKDLNTREWLSTFEGYVRFVAEATSATPRATFTGGEVMTRRDFFELASAARRLGIRLEVFTNGTYLTSPSAVARLAECVDQVQLSLDGATEAVNDEVRGRGTYKKVVRAMHLLAEKGIRFRLAVTLLPPALDDVSRNLVPLLKQFGDLLFEVKIGLANVQGRAGSEVRFEDTVQAEEAMRRVLAPLYEAGLRRPRVIRPNFRGLSCGYGRTFTVASDGTVYGCAIPACPVGNVRDEPVRDLAAKVWALGDSTGIDHVEGCRSCELRYFCFGLCRLNNVFHRGSLMLTCCTAAKKQEVLRKLVHRELAPDPWLAAAARVGSFWQQSAGAAP